VGCAPSEDNAMGTVSLNLVGQAPSGAAYRLRHAVITVTRFGTTSRIWNTEDDPTRTSLSDNVEAGDYTVSLAPGWNLERVDGASATPVTAQLISPNPSFFVVAPQQRITVPLRFHVDTGDTDIDLSQGYDIVIGIEEPGPQIIVVANAQDFRTGSITVYPGNADGDVAPLRTIAGPRTRLIEPFGVAVTDDEIVVCDLDTVSFFPINGNGNVAPNRQIAGAQTGLTSCMDVIVYNGEVYVTQPEALLVFPIAANGDVAPTRQIRGFSFGAAAAVDRGELYVSDFDAGTVSAYALPLAEAAAPTRLLAVDCAEGLAAGNGELFVTNGCSPAAIDVYPASASGNPPPLRTLAGDRTGMVAPVQFARFQRELYVADIELSQIFIYPEAASGNTAPARTIGGPHTGLSTPVDVAVH